jgi:hypothetical protein
MRLIKMLVPIFPINVDLDFAATGPFGGQADLLKETHCEKINSRGLGHYR